MEAFRDALAKGLLISKSWRASKERCTVDVYARCSPATHKLQPGRAGARGGP
jgi:hypothetical protein